MKPSGAVIDAAMLDAKLAELSRRLKRIETKRPASLKALAADEDLRDILARNLEVAIQGCIDIALHLCASLAVRGNYRSADLSAPDRSVAQALCAN